MQSKINRLKPYLAKTAKPVGVVLCALLLSVTIFQLLFWDKVYPGVYVGSLHLGGKTKPEAAQLIQKAQDGSSLSEFTFVTTSGPYTLSKEKISLEYSAQATADAALSVGRKRGFLGSAKEIWTALKHGIRLDYSYWANDLAITTFVEGIDQEISIPRVPPKIEVQNGKIVIDPGRIGKSIDKEEVRQDLYNAIRTFDQGAIEVSENTIDAPTQEEITALYKRAEKFIGARLALSLDDTSILLTDKELVGMIGPEGGFSQEAINARVEMVAKEVDRPVQNALLKFEGSRVVEFKPAKDGLETNKEELKSRIIEQLSRVESGAVKETSLTIPAFHTTPKVANDNVNNLGIKERIGYGVSYFRGSSPSRVHNIGLAASRINGILIPPGETYSFNSAIGDVTTLTGYKQAYVIDRGKIVLGDGGGVCQVSTTFFRTTLNAGLPVIERRAHSYRVSYYEQGSSPGIDATVFSPSPDLKIKNDTPAHILIQTTFDAKKMTLVVELYGTSDGRVATLTKPKMTDVTPAPEEIIYQDDPTLPAGTLKEVNPKVSGAKVVFDYKVTRGDTALQDRKFSSVYRPWQALTLRGTGGATQTQ